MKVVVSMIVSAWCFILLIVVLLELKQTCETGWKQSGFRSRYEANTCLVEVSPGRWLPEKNVVVTEKQHQGETK